MDTQISLNQIPSEPSMKDLLDQLKKDIFLSLFCHHIGTVQSFDATKQTATATVNYKKTIFQLNRATGLYAPVLVNYPVLLDCPVIFLGGGTASLTCPVKKNDECLILFNDRDIDNWFKGSSTSPVATSRAHSFSDGLILVGIRSLAHVLENFEIDRISMRNGSARTSVTDDELVDISNDDTDLNSILSNLVSTINGLVQVISTGIPIVAPPATPYEIAIAAAAASAITGLTGVTTDIGDLLE
jgi:hypothetical protein